MKTASILFATATLALAQGTLAPPGAPAPVMKTLAQIEPRTDVLTLAGDANASRVISISGSYYLSGNLPVPVGDISSIRITASNVTLDLEGFCIAGVGAGNAGIQIVGALKGIVIRNGSITGFSYSINGGGSLKDSRVSNITAGGAVTSGIDLGSDPTNTVEHCSVRDGQLCISAGQVHYCTAETASSGQGAISATCCVSNSTGISTASNTFGISTWDGTSIGPSAIGGTVTNCTGKGRGYGIRSISVTDSIGNSGLGLGYGIYVFRDVHRSTGDAMSGAGIFAGGNVSFSTGACGDGRGISAGGSVQNCTGRGGYISDGIYAGGNVENSMGLSDDAKGISASGSVANSTGWASPNILPASAGIGIKAEIVSFSRGNTATGGKGIQATTAVGCTSTGGDVITNKYQMP